MATEEQRSMPTNQQLVEIWSSIEVSLVEAGGGRMFDTAIDQMTDADRLAVARAAWEAAINGN